MFLRIAVDFAGGRVQEARAGFSAEIEQVPDAARARGEDIQPARAEVDRRGGAGEVVNDLERPLDAERFDDIVLDEPELWPGLQIVDVGQLSGREVIDADDLVPVVEQAFTQVISDEPGTAGHKQSHGGTPGGMGHTNPKKTRLGRWGQSPGRVIGIIVVIPRK